LQEDVKFTTEKFKESLPDYEGYFFPCCCGLNEFEHTEAGKIKLRFLDDRKDFNPVIFKDPMTGELQGLIEEDYIVH
jgi:hypothetical protein